MPKGIYVRVRPVTIETHRKQSVSQTKRYCNEDERKKTSDSCKGLLKSEETKNKISKRMKGKNKGVPRSEEVRKKISNGLTGKPKTKEHNIKVGLANKGKRRIMKEITRHKISVTMKDKFIAGELSPNPNPIRGRAYFRKDLNHFFRSMWEANIARILSFLGIKYEYESKLCRFNLGNSTYICDFYLLDLNKYIEVKGYLYENCREKLKQFVKLFPTEAGQVLVIDDESYGYLNKLFKDKIPEWEF